MGRLLKAIFFDFLALWRTCEERITWEKNGKSRSFGDEACLEGKMVAFGGRDLRFHRGEWDQALNGGCSGLKRE